MRSTLMAIGCLHILYLDFNNQLPLIGTKEEEEEVLLWHNQKRRMLFILWQSDIWRQLPLGYLLIANKLHTNPHIMASGCVADNTESLINCQSIYPRRECIL